ncbi:dephospho-CoA kinase [Vibrio sp. Of7-15]|uniref:dephospho-CoA kinase n=1 Tax=Vibrio sp. Of7-15 TaxID=2724879 RepID=UPI001EF39310|nr:dephospho-CoA kinase [Vibrio sp. Of7-15]MCG7498168.1 dephospho-CoA kinase [Vibrio sp. Of7-15]
MSLVIGLTGGIGSGKTTVANLFAEMHHIDIIDADIIARDVVEKGSVGLNKISQHFGTEVLLPSGELDRAKLRERIFSNPEEKTWLNNLLHPLIRTEMVNQTQQATSPYCLLVIPLMVENNLQSLAERILVVDVSEETQIARTTQRDNVSDEQVKNILKAQASRQQRLDSAHDVICNDGKNMELKPIISTLHYKYLELSQQLQTQ